MSMAWASKGLNNMNCGCSIVVSKTTAHLPRSCWQFTTMGIFSVLNRFWSFWKTFLIRGKEVGKMPICTAVVETAIYHLPHLVFWKQTHKQKTLSLLLHAELVVYFNWNPMIQQPTNRSQVKAKDSQVLGSWLSAAVLHQPPQCIGPAGGDGDSTAKDKSAVSNLSILYW